MGHFASLKTLSLLILTASGGIYIYFLFQIFNSTSYSFAHVDELTYFLSGKMFYETSSLKAPFCFMEDVSPVFQTHWYGIFYHLFYGSIFKVTGFHPLIFIFLNLLFVILIFVSVHRFKISYENKMVLWALLSVSYPILVYSTMFFPEILHLSMAFPLIYLLFRISGNFTSNNCFNKDLLIYIALVLFFTLFRITFIFWLAAIIPFSKNGKQFLQNMLIFMGGIAFTLIYMHYFVAPAFVKSLSVLEKLKDFQFQVFFKESLINLIFNLQLLVGFLWIEKQVLVYVALFLILLLMSIIQKNRFLIAALVVSSIYLFVLLLLYDAYPFYFTKQTAATIPLMLTGIVVFSKNIFPKLVVFIIILIAFPHTVITANQEIRLRIKAGDDLVRLKKEINDLGLIKYYATGEKDIYIEVLHYEHSIPSSAFYASLPVSNMHGQPITYTASIHNVRLFPKMVYEDRFIRFGKLPVGFVLSRYPLNIENTKLLFKGSFFYFYKDNRE